MNEFVTVRTGDEQPGIATLVWSRPPTNAMTRQLYREIAAACAELAVRDDLFGVVLFGGHEIFSAGDDASEWDRLGADEEQAGAAVRARALDAVAALPKPTVAAVTGYALGAGLGLALAADWRVSGDNAKFGATEILAGRPPGAAPRLVRVVGDSTARDMVFSGRFVAADEALRLGLVDELSAPDHVYDDALAWVRRFAGYPAPALAAAKSAFARGR